MVRRFETSPTTVGWSVARCGRSSGTVEVGAGFKPGPTSTGVKEGRDHIYETVQLVQVFLNSVA